jgi:hypothetical protein
LEDSEGKGGQIGIECWKEGSKVKKEREEKKRMMEWTKGVVRFDSILSPPIKFTSSHHHEI